MSRSRSSAAAEPACRSRTSFPMPPRWSSCSAMGKEEGMKQALGRSMPSLPRTGRRRHALIIARRPNHSTLGDHHDDHAATKPITQTLAVPGATLTYDVRASEATTEPTLVLIGSPMGAGGFPSLAAHFPDRTIVTYDPRNNGERSPAGRSRACRITPEHAGRRRARGHRGDRRRPGRHVRQQRRRGRRAGARGEASRTTSEPSWPTSRRWHRSVSDREQALAATRAIYDTYQAQRRWRRHGQVHAGRACTAASSPPRSPRRRAWTRPCSGMPTEDDG